MVEIIAKCVKVQERNLSIKLYKNKLEMKSRNGQVVGTSGFSEIASRIFEQFEHIIEQKDTIQSNFHYNILFDSSLREIIFSTYVKISIIGTVDWDIVNKVFVFNFDDELMIQIEDSVNDIIGPVAIETNRTPRHSRYFKEFNDLKGLDSYLKKHVRDIPLHFTDSWEVNGYDKNKSRKILVMFEK